MMEATDRLEISAKSVDEAVSAALTQLKITKEEAKITVLDTGSKGLFGLGAKPARILCEVIFDPEGKAKKLLREIAVSIGVSVEVEAKLEDKVLSINLTGGDLGVFIGKRGQTLDSLQYLVNLAINKGRGTYTSVVLDSGDYRQRRRDTLESLSFNLARKVKSTQRPVLLEPMSSSERRIIHSALQNDKYVTTYSEGEEPFRNVVIAPKKGSYAPRKYDRPKTAPARKHSDNE